MVTAGTDLIKDYTFISDTPVVGSFCNIFFAFPKAMYLQTFRPAVDWATTRKQFMYESFKLRAWDLREWKVSEVCNPPPEDGSIKKLKADVTAAHYAVLTTFVRCVSPPDRWLGVNVFSQNNTSVKGMIKDNGCKYING